MGEEEQTDAAPVTEEPAAEEPAAEEPTDTAEPEAEPAAE
jgi:hypothetical protein|tara:strand:- start:1767 stop:1886 length:120 start_codon:yes stop_codon:yes gene_type:complete